MGQTMIGVQNNFEIYSIVPVDNILYMSMINNGQSKVILKFFDITSTTDPDTIFTLSNSTTQMQIDAAGGFGVSATVTLAFANLVLTASDITSATVGYTSAPAIVSTSSFSIGGV